MVFKLGTSANNMERETEVFVFPASFAQQRLWFLNQLAPGNPFYNVSTALRLTGSLNLSVLEQTFNEIVRRHETLRTTFVMLEGQLAQIIAPILTLPLPTIDLSTLPSTQREIEARRLAKAEAQRPFDLAKGPLFRVIILQMSEAEYVLLLNLHHIVADGWSIGVLIRELGAIYTAFLNDLPSPLPELPIQYADFTEWQHQWLQGEVVEKQLAYWRQQLNGITLLNLPTDRCRPAITTYQGAKQLIRLSPDLSEALKLLSKQENTTLFMTLIAAFQTLLYRYTGQEDIAVGSPIANRNLSEVEDLIGFFVNSLVLRVDLSGNPTFQELLMRVKKITMEAYSHQDLPFEKLVAEIQPERNLSRNPLFDISFSLQNTPLKALELPELTLSVLDLETETTKLDLEIHLWEDLESIKGEVNYSTDLFNDATIARIIGHFQTLLEGIVSNPKYRLSDLPILTSVERHQILVEFNQIPSKISSQNSKNYLCFHQLFEAQVERSPQAVAAVFEGQYLTYYELNSRANQLAHYLHQLGVSPEVVVGICIERSLEMIVGLLGILKAGGAYLPLDPNYPQERLNFMLEDAQVSILITHSITPHFYKINPPGVATTCGKHQHELRLVIVDVETKAISQQSLENPTSNVTLDNLVYVIYTSGSTGIPKGVLIEQRGLSNLAEAQIKTFNLHPNNRVLQFASLSFDASIFEIVMALGSGATLYLAKKESLLPGQPLIQFLRENSITHATLPPAVLKLLPNEELSALKTLICAGESCSQDIVKRWTACSTTVSPINANLLTPKIQFFNAYGPTEATVWSTLAEITNCTEKISIGRPIFNTIVYILDQYLQPVLIGSPGEIYIGSDGLARGYLNQPKLTTERFIINPFREMHLNGSEFTWPERLYKTGDLARYRPDGNIEFLGRTDEQVKIRGYRIELEEIEAVLGQHLAVKETVVIAQLSPTIPAKAASLNQYQCLIAYLVPNYNRRPTSNELRSFLQLKLPDYMIPHAFVWLDSLPLTLNGKIDRRQLPIPDSFSSNSIDSGFIFPRTSTEMAIAKIWAEVLNLKSVSIRDNFFDLGGDSLLAIRIIEQIKQQYDQKLPVSNFFLYPTIESFANSLLIKTDSLPWTSLVPIQPQGSNSPFFCVHPIFGVVFPYYELASHLGKNQPFYGLQPKGIDGKHPPLTSIEDMAAYYIEALRTVQPNGPYFLGGWSFGGLVAFEMAQQLQKSGQKVALLAVIDTLAPVSANIVSLGDSLKFFLTTASRSIWPFLRDYLYLLTDAEKPQNEGLAQNYPQLYKFFQRAANFFKECILGQAAIADFLPQESKRAILRELTFSPMFPVFQANSQATLNYVPQIYPNRITLFRSSEQISIAHRNPTLGWNELTADQVEVIRLPGNHLTMLRKPHVQVLAEQLRQYFC